LSSRWHTRPLGEILTERQEKPTEKALSDGTIRIVAKIGFSEGNIHLRSGGNTNTGMILVRPGDILLSGINASKGAVAFYGEDNTEPIAATIHYGAYAPDKEQVEPLYLWWLLRSNTFRDLLKHHVPGGIKTELKSKRLLPIPVPLPPLKEQRDVLKKLLSFEKMMKTAQELRHQVRADVRKMLLSAYSKVATDVPRCSILEVAPLQRRPIAVDPEGQYRELGIRSFGKGTFHKPTLTGLEIGTKRIFSIEPGDLLFGIVFAWEGAVAVAKPEDAGRVGSHRFLTCVVNPEMATAQFLRFHFSTKEGLEQLGHASPGGAGRNRTLGLSALNKIMVPVPTLEQQQWFDRLQAKVAAVSDLGASTDEKFSLLMASVLDRAIQGTL